MKCVIFDLDGTLTQSEEGIINCVKYAAEKLNWPLPDEETLHKFIGPPLQYGFMEYMGRTKEEAEAGVEAYRERYNDIGLFENRVYPGIRRLLRMLKQQGCYLGVATGKPEEPSRRILAKFKLDKYLDAIVGPAPSDLADKKRLIQKALPETYDEAWMVGDRCFDIAGAKAVGIGSIGVGYGYGTRQELEEAGCDVYVDTVQQLIDTLCPNQPVPKGAFLTMEGPDGSGKTTQMKYLVDNLSRYGFEVRPTREPGGCGIAESIRRVLLDLENKSMEPVTEALLFAAARAQHVRQVIRPAVAAGQVVVSDRFVDSSVAYQGGGRLLGVQTVLDMNAPAVDDTMPCGTVYLDIDHETAMKRRFSASVPDRMELAGDSLHRRTEAAYKELIARDPQRFLVVDAAQDPQKVAEDVLEKVLNRLMDEEDA